MSGAKAQKRWVSSSDRLRTMLLSQTRHKSVALTGQQLGPHAAVACPF